jgi:hypothetical protein
VSATGRSTVRLGRGGILEYRAGIGVCEKFRERVTHRHGGDELGGRDTGLDGAYVIPGCRCANGCSRFRSRFACYSARVAPDPRGIERHGAVEAVGQ